ncbi:TetR/AcrR family transcriptional regulator [Streptomyces sp. NPDC021224]|uniref:TetR/AcrR family transcriptional regulator n=1 Tax=unclassified Streptomyces TaxID=2593676 RepID=UPI0037A66D8B
MADELGLRERKKLRTGEHISETAVALFLRDGFDGVSVADVAAAAEVSKKTVFNYFPTKEDLVFHPLRDHIDEPARVVRSRRPGESPVAALRRHFLAGLAAGDPSTGLADYPEFLAFQRMVMAAPSLKLRLMEQWILSEDSLAEALAEVLFAGDGGVAGDPSRGIVPRALAGQTLAVQRALTVRNLERMLARERDPDALAQATAEAELAFGLLAKAFP